MRAVDPGFRADHVLVAGFQLPLNQYSTNVSANSFTREVMERLSNKPGTLAVGTANVLPASGAVARAAYTIEGQRKESWKLKFSSFALTDGDFFRAMDIPLIEGRTFTIKDDANAPLVVVVNQSMAKHSWPGQRPIGKRMHVGNPDKGYPWATVVGVVADTKTGARDEPALDQWYAPVRQPAILLGSASSQPLTAPANGFITLRSALPPEQMIQTLRTTVAEVDPLLALDPVQSMEEVVSNIEAPRRFNTNLITAFAAGAIGLAITGIYAVIAFSVSLRMREMAIRLTLGAHPRQIMRLVLKSGATLALLGCILGILGSLAAGRLVGSFLFGVSATDPLIYLAGALIMMLMALLASALPAAKAAAADPIDALRSI
jgi:putative ABC transport system permease protein